MRAPCSRAMRIGFAIGGFGGGGVALGEDVAPEPVKERIRAVTARLLGERETLRDRCECDVDRARFALELGENALAHISPIGVPGRTDGRQRSRSSEA